MRRGIAALLLVVALFVGAEPAEAAAPWFVIVHGSLLDTPVLLDDWEENLELMLAISETVRMEAGELDRRRYLDVALFWGLDWADYPLDAESLGQLSPEQANQHGRFYPAVGVDEPALFLFGNTSTVSEMLSVRVVERRMLEIFEAHRIPIQIERGDSWSLQRLAVLGGAVAVLVVVGLLVVVRRRGVELGVSSSGATRHRR